MIQTRSKFLMRPTALVLAASLVAPALAGCGGPKESIPPPVDETRSGGNMNNTNSGSPAPKPGMSTGKKVVIALAGAALLYYLYKHHQEQSGQKVTYYKSKNGRIYYRDPKTHQVHWVTPDPNGYAVSPEEQQQLQKFQGYNNQSTGEDYQGQPDTSGAQ